ncbi:MAG: AraC family transcriptional regulator [Clostridia bacterium]|nr:AraC family transcriptional regulator [Clostridia bacterium]
MSYTELKQPGSADFPFALYQIDRNHPKYEMAYHWHAEHEIIRVLAGSLRITLNNREMTAQAGDLIYVNSETVHGAVPNDCVYECIVYTPGFLSMPGSDFMDGLLNHSIFVKEFFSHDDPETAELRYLADEVFTAMDAETAGYRFSVIGDVYAMLGWIADHGAYEEQLALQFRSARDEKNVQKLKRVLTFIRTSYDQQITLHDMAEAAGVSPQYFCAFFKTMTEKSPTEYLNSYRIERACRKL